MVRVIITFEADQIKANDNLKRIDKDVKKEEKKIKKAEEDTIALRTRVAEVLAVVNAAVGFVRLFSEIAGRQVAAQFLAQLNIATLTIASAVQLAALAGAQGNVAIFIYAGAIAASAASLIAATRSAQNQARLEFLETQQRSLNLAEDF